MNTKRYLMKSVLNRIKTSSSIFCLVFLVGCANLQSPEALNTEKFAFGLIGDQQYDPESEAKFPALMDDVNRSNLAFVVHVGDFKGRHSPCDDGTFKQRKAQFAASEHPFIYTPGDNDWTDCHDAEVGSYNPNERLRQLRAFFFQGNQSLGQRKLAVERQSDLPQFSSFPENVRWSYGNILFVTLHIVGSNNNLGRVPEADAEYHKRNLANLAWLKDAFAAAKRQDCKAVAIFIHANPHFEYALPPKRVRNLAVRPPPEKPSGFADFIATLEAEVTTFTKPVVLLHGDTHYFRVDKPLFKTGEAGPENLGHQLANFTRVETFGFPESQWVQVIVDPDDPQVFTFKQQLVDKNLSRKP